MVKGLMMMMMTANNLQTFSNMPFSSYKWTYKHLIPKKILIDERSYTRFSFLLLPRGRVGKRVQKKLKKLK